MGSYDGAKVCEIVGMFMLVMLSKSFEKNSIGLYRDDGLSVFRNYNRHQNDRVRKGLMKLLQKYQLNLYMKCNLKIVDYLYISFALNTGIYKPFNNPNSKPLYINASSNHPLSVLKQIPKSVSKRIFSNSCNEDIFRKSALFYNSILQDIKYCPEELVSSRRRKGPFIVCIEVSTPPQKHHPLFFATPPLNLQTVQAPRKYFSQFSPIYWSFMNPRKSRISQ